MTILRIVLRILYSATLLTIYQEFVLRRNKNSAYAPHICPTRRQRSSHPIGGTPADIFIIPRHLY